MASRAWSSDKENSKADRHMNAKKWMLRHAAAALACPGLPTPFPPDVRRHVPTGRRGGTGAYVLHRLHPIPVLAHGVHLVLPQELPPVHTALVRELHQGLAVILKMDLQVQYGRQALGPLPHADAAGLVLVAARVVHFELIRALRDQLLQLL